MKEMFINAQRDECRIAIVSDGELSELYVERASAASQVGNIFKGRITNVEPSIQAAFVDFGKIKNGFLHISDLHPEYFPKGQQAASEAVGKKRARRDRPPIQGCLRRGQEVIVQVTKEGIGTKGATLTTYLSIPGRYLVLMPGMHRLGVSRKIENEDARLKMRQILEELKPPEDLGFIVRTAGIDQSKADLQRDLQYLLRLWKAVSQRSQEAHAPAELYQESDLVIRTIRDVYNAAVTRIVCDDEGVACKVKEFLQLTMPRAANRVELYTGKIGLFHAFGLEQEIERINSARVPLPAGGSLVIDQTEALVAIDVNSGRYRDTDNPEQTALHINTEAAREVARQLRLRDLGGVVVIDFIDMIDDKHCRQIERILRDEVKKDRARTKILRMSRFCIVEMTRQRMRPSLTSSVFRPCAHCAGLGRTKSDESQALSVMRTLTLAAGDEHVTGIELTVPPAVADYVLNQRRELLADLEKSTGTRIAVHPDPTLPAGDVRIACTDSRGSALQWDVNTAIASLSKDAPTREITDADLETVRHTMPVSGEEPAPSPEKIAATVAHQVAEMDDEEEALGEADEAGEAVEPSEPIDTITDEDQAVPIRSMNALPQAPAAQTPAAPGQPQRPQGHGQPGQPAQPGQPGETGQGKRRRRRRGGRKHRRHHEQQLTQQGQGGAPTQPGQPGPQDPGAPQAQPAQQGQPAQQRPQGQPQQQRPQGQPRQPRPDQQRRQPQGPAPTAPPSPVQPPTAAPPQGGSGAPIAVVVIPGPTPAVHQPSKPSVPAVPPQPVQTVPAAKKPSRNRRGGRRHKPHAGATPPGQPPLASPAEPAQPVAVQPPAAAAAPAEQAPVGQAPAVAESDKAKKPRRRPTRRGGKKAPPPAEPSGDAGGQSA